MNGIEYKSARELEIMHRANAIVLDTLSLLSDRLHPGITTRELDSIAARRIRQAGATPAFKGYRGYPANICISINEEVVHGIPGKRVIREGDIVSIDLGTILEGYVGDAAATFPVGEVSETARHLIEVTRQALFRGIDAVRAGGRLSDIGARVQRHAESQGFSVVRQFVGHGIGRRMHEEPQVPNYGEPGYGPELRPGIVLAIEPMVNAGASDVTTLDDNWTAVTADGSLSAHFEYSVAVTPEGPWILGLEATPGGTSSADDVTDGARSRNEQGGNPRT